MKASEILGNALKLLRSPKRWKKGYYAFTKTGAQTSPFNPDATCFCAIGLLQRGSTTGEVEITDGGLKRLKQSGDSYERSKARDYVEKAIRDTALSRSVNSPCGIVAFNDYRGTTFEDVKTVFRVAHRLALDSETAAA